jgi:hypothetical protein
VLDGVHFDFFAGKPVMAALKKSRKQKPLSDRVYDLLFEFEAAGRRKRAVPLILWLVEMAWEIEGKELPGQPSREPAKAQEGLGTLQMAE